MRQKFLVVGGTGFIGHNIIKSFSLKKYKLFSISKKIPHTKKIKGVCYIACDITNFKKLFYFSLLNSKLPVIELLKWKDELEKNLKQTEDTAAFSKMYIELLRPNFFFNLSTVLYDLKS